MRPLPQGPDKDNPVRLGSVRMEGTPPPDYPFQRRLLREALIAVPQQVGIGWNRYDTDDEHVLHLWNEAGESFDIRVPIRAAGQAVEPKSGIEAGTTPEAPDLRDLQRRLRGWLDDPMPYEGAREMVSVAERELTAALAAPKPQLRLEPKRYSLATPATPRRPRCHR